MWSKVVLAVALAGGLAYSGHKSSSCPGGRCCVLTPEPSSTNCCYIGSECCFPGSPCCDQAKSAEKLSCCPDGACCPDGDCCGKAQANCCGPDSPCCPDGACCGGK